MRKDTNHILNDVITSGGTVINTIMDTNYALNAVHSIDEHAIRVNITNLSGGTEVGGNDTNVQFNDGGTLNGVDGFNFQKTNTQLTIGTSTISATNSDRVMSIGFSNTITPLNAAANADDSFVTGQFCTVGNLYAVAHGRYCQALGSGSFAAGSFAVARGNSAFAMGKNIEANGQASLGGGQAVTGDINADGLTSFNFSYCDSVVDGATADHSAILGGINHANRGENSAILGGEDSIITATAVNSVILGGDNIQATRASTVYVPTLEVVGAHYNKIEDVDDSTYTLASDDYILHCTYTTEEPMVITIPTAQMVQDGREFTVKDAGFNASTNNITITPQTGLIENAASFIIDNDGDSFTFYSYGGELFIK